MSGPLVSVVVLSYDRPAYLDEALRSVVTQNFEGTIEVLVADDASPSIDAILAVIAAIGDSRITLLQRASNAGVVRNVLDAVARARGEFLAILCDDDTWEPDFLARLVPPLAADPSLAAAFSDHWITDGRGNVDEDATNASTQHWQRAGMRRGTYRPFDREALIARSMQPVMATVLRRSAIDWSDFPTQTGPAYDLWIAYLACRDGAGAYYEAARLSNYRVHDAAQTAVAGVPWNAGKAYTYRRILADGTLPQHARHFRRMLSFAELRTGISLLRDGRPHEARACIVTALRGGQRGPRAIGALGLSVLPAAVARRVFAVMR